MRLLEFGLKDDFLRIKMIESIFKWFLNIDNLMFWLSRFKGTLWTHSYGISWEMWFCLLQTTFKGLYCSLLLRQFLLPSTLYFHCLYLSLRLFLSLKSSACSKSRKHKVKYYSLIKQLLYVMTPMGRFDLTMLYLIWRTLFSYTLNHHINYTKSYLYIGFTFWTNIFSVLMRRKNKTFKYSLAWMY